MPSSLTCVGRPDGSVISFPSPACSTGPTQSSHSMPCKHTPASQHAPHWHFFPRNFVMNSGCLSTFVCDVAAAAASLLGVSGVAKGPMQSSHMPFSERHMSLSQQLPHRHALESAVLFPVPVCTTVWPVCTRFKLLTGAPPVCATGEAGLCEEWLWIKVTRATT